MRLLPFALVLFIGLPALAFSQERAECEYRSPDNPNWNYLRACTVTSRTNGTQTTTTAEVNNGSTLTIVEERVGEALSFRINGYAATRLETGASRCFLTIDDEETICIHTDGAAPVETAAPVPDTPADTLAGTPAGTIESGFGGGEPGHCLAWVSAEAREGLIGHGACTRRSDCAEIEGEGGMSCLIDFIWESGAETVITQRNDVYTLDGAVAAPADTGCLTDEAAGLHFCFSAARMTEASYPALAMNPAPAPEHRAAAPAAEPPAAAQDTAGAATPPGDRCSFLRDDVEVSSWACTETVACEAPLCTVTYVLENGTNVTLDTADGQVMLMNGAKANAAAWADGAVVDVTRPGAPYTFRFIPGSVQAAQ